MKYLLLGLVHFYRKAISPFTPATCRFYPTCSEYAVTALRRFGAVKGGYLALKRVGKCHPFHQGGIDPVPDKRPSRDGRD